VSEARADRAAATERKRLGVATLEEVLQTQTELAQAQFQLATDEGNLLAARGDLAVEMGLQPNARFDIPDIAVPSVDSVATVMATVDTLVNRAVTQRPEIAEARAEAAELAAAVRVARAAGYPTITLRSTASALTTRQNTNTQSHNFSVVLGVQVPIFNGFATPYNSRAAREQYEAGLARVQSVEQQVTLQVFTSYFALRAAADRVRSAAALLRSAEQSAVVAAARYREGVGTIVDVLLARTSLDTARAEAIQSRWEWRTALVQLGHDAGSLDVHGHSNLPLGFAPAATR
jgi:outer membrane protein TolC